MGCGGSKHESASNQLMVHAKVKPLLHRRLEDVRRRRNTNSSNDNKTLSRKELLKDGGSDDTSSASDRPLEDDSKSVSSGESNNLRKVKPAADFSDEPAIKDIEVDTFVESTLPVHQKVAEKGQFHQDETKPAITLKPEGETEKLCRENRVELEDGKDGDEVVKVIEEADVVEITDQDGDGTGNDSDEEKDGRHISLRSARDCPGSPSFRVYFVESLDLTKDDMDVDVDGEERDDHTEKMSQKNEELGSRTVKSVIPDENSVTKKVKKGKKGGKFRKVMQVSKGTGAVKSLLNVNIRSCYNPLRSGQDKDQLLSYKTVA